MKRICFVCKEVDGDRGGGLHAYVVEAGLALQQHGCETWLLTTGPERGRHHPPASMPGFAHVRFVGEGVSLGDRPRFMHGRPCYDHAHLVHRTLQALGVAFDYIEFPDREAEGLVACQEQRLFGAYRDALLAVMLHGPTREKLSFNGQQHRMGHQERTVAAMEDETMRVAPELRAPSRAFASLVVRRLGLTPNVRIARWPMRLGPELPPPAPRSRLSDLRFLYFGRLEPRKGVAELVEAFRELPDLELTLIGSDSPLSPYGASFREHLRRRAPGNVRFAEAMPHQALLSSLASYDVCVFPSQRENWPKACTEAMAASRVVLAGREGGLGEMVEDDVSGILMESCDPMAIVRAVRERLASRLDRLDAMGRAAARRSRELADPSAYASCVLSAIDEHSVRLPSRSASAGVGRVSVIVPFHRDRKTIDEAVDSALGQTHGDLEVVLVDDGSPLPDSADILERQAAKDRRVRVLRQSNRGPAAARNLAIDRSAGDYLLFLDADNVLRPEYAAFAVGVLSRFPEAGFVVPQARFFADGSQGTLEVFNALPFERATCLLYNSLGDTGACFRRSLFTQLGLRYDEALIGYEDWALWLDLACQGVRGEIMPRIMYDYRVRPGSINRATALPNHRDLMGLLIERHLPRATPEEIDVLTTVLQLWTEAWLHPPLRYRIVDDLSRLAGKVPFLGRALRVGLGGLARLAGLGGRGDGSR